MSMFTRNETVHYADQHLQTRSLCDNTPENPANENISRFLSKIPIFLLRNPVGRRHVCDLLLMNDN